MERITISLEEELARAFDALIAARGYSNRSEAMRDLLRKEIEAAGEESRPAQGACIASLSYVFNHHQRDLAERITALQHDHHDLSLATMHAHLDHDHCLETSLLRGPSDAVRRFAQRLMAENGVRHGALNLIAVEVARAEAPHGHDHSHPHAGSSHVHYRPRM